MTMDLLELPVLHADHRVAYGADPAQFGDLWMPAETGRKRLPLVVFFHGGWWKSEYGLGYAGYLCQALKREGFAVWSVEYRRLGSTGGGWPETFQDASAGFEFITTLAKSYALDLGRVITMGHSAGGHLAFWIAGRVHVTEGSPLVRTAFQAAPSGAISLAGAVDLRRAIQLSATPGYEHVRDRIRNFMGGLPAEQPQRYRDGDPGELLPLPVRQVLLQGSKDDQIPPDLPRQWVRAANASGSVASALILPDADHFDVVDPRSRAWPEVLAAVRRLLSDC